MRVLFLQHDPGSDPGLVGADLAARGATIEALPMASSIGDPTWHDDFPTVGDHDLVVPLGAIWSVYDVEGLSSWIERELAWLRALDDAGVPVLGICFGGQALARAHGGRVEAMTANDIGFGTVTPVDGAAIPAGPWMQWHGDHFVPPDDATVLATADVGIQAFTLRANLGLQFHPEVTSDIIAHWVSLGGPAAHDAAAAAGTSVDELVAEADRHRDRASHDITRMLDWWLPTVGLA